MVGALEDEGCRARAALLGAYKLGETLGEGSFGKVKHALRRATGENFAVKILDRGRVLSLRGADDQVRREIATLTMFRHPNVVRLHEVSNSILACLSFSAIDHWIC
jgi:5'-AMP-activated protein kinase catalytic alpha subunit